MHEDILREGVRDGIEFWLAQHPISAGDILKQGIADGVRLWLESHADIVVRGIAEEMERKTRG